jgi:hypothetical protein
MDQRWRGKVLSSSCFVILSVVALNTVSTGWTSDPALSEKTNRWPAELYYYGCAGPIIYDRIPDSYNRRGRPFDFYAETGVNLWHTLRIGAQFRTKNHLYFGQPWSGFHNRQQSSEEVTYINRGIVIDYVILEAIFHDVCHAAEPKLYVYGHNLLEFKRPERWRARLLLGFGVDYNEIWANSAVDARMSSISANIYEHHFNRVGYQARASWELLVCRWSSLRFVFARSWSNPIKVPELIGPDSSGIQRTLDSRSVRVVNDGTFTFGWAFRL